MTWWIGGLLAAVFTAPLMAAGISLPAFWAGLVAVTLLLAGRQLPWPVLRILCWVAAGMVWGDAAVQQGLSGWLPPEQAGQTLLLTGQVADLPVTVPQWHGRQRLEFVLAGARASQWPGQHRVRLRWYDPQVTLRPGDRVAVQARLLPPRGWVNEGTQDRARLDLARGIDASGSVVELAILAPATGGMAAYRDQLGQQLTEHLGVHRAGGRVIPALVSADRRQLSRADWTLLQVSGTAHLMAISGLHIVLVAGLVWWLARGLLTPWSVNWRITAAQWAVWPALAAAAGYAALAGFALPTLRALIMLGVAMVALWARWRPGSRAGLLLAATAVLAADPLAALDNSFWLSFSAVALLLWLAWSGARPGLLRMQLLLSLGLGALTGWLFTHWGLTSPLANLVMVPLFSLAVIPLALLGSLLPGLGGLLEVAAWLVQACWLALAWLVEHDPLLPPPATLLAAVLILIGCVTAVMPRPPWPRWLAPLLLLPWLWPADQTLAQGDFDLIVFDVGQGQATAIRTASHLMLYDFGPGWPGGDAGAMVLRPWLVRQRRPVTLAFVSHGDLDHVGGLAGVRELLPAQALYSGDPAAIPGTRACLRGQQWQLDGVTIEVLWPPPAVPLQQRNNTSCVVRVSGAGGAVLLTGDITRPVEYWLVAQEDFRQHRPVTVLQVPHHGSRTSSSYPLLRAVQPEWGVATAGYANRFQHPAETIRARYAELGIPLLISYETGMIVFSLHGSHNPAPILWRQRYPRPWRPAVSSVAGRHGES